MQENRKARLASVIMEELSVQIRHLKDPRVPSITLTSVDVAHDGSHATVFFTLLGGNDDRDKVKGALEGLASASGLLRRHLAKVLTIRHVPTLNFKEDRGLDNALRVHALLQEIDGAKKPADDEGSGPTDA